MSWTLVNSFLNLDGVTSDYSPKSDWDVDLTYNYSPMLNKAFQIANLNNPEGRHLHNLSRLNNKEAAPIINKLYATMLHYREDIEKLEPENGWGTYEQLLETVRDIFERNTNCLNENFVWCSF